MLIRIFVVLFVHLPARLARLRKGGVRSCVYGGGKYPHPWCSVKNICILQVHNIAFNGDGSLARLVTRSLGTIFRTEALPAPLPFVYWSLQLLHKPFGQRLLPPIFDLLFWYQLTVDVVLQIPFLVPLQCQ